MSKIKRFISRARLGWSFFRKSLIWDLLVAQKAWVWAAIGLSLVNLAVAGAALQTLRSIVDNGIVDKVVRIDPLIGRLALLSVLAACTGFAQRQTTARLGWQLEYDLRTLVHTRLMAADPRGLDRLASGQLVTRAMTDLAVVQRVALALPMLLLAIFPVLAGLFIVLSSSFLMGIVALIPLPVNFWLIRRIRSRLYVLTYSSLDARAAVTTKVDEAVRGIRVVKAFGREDHERGRVKAHAQRAYAIALTLARLMANWDVLLKIVPSVFRTLEMVIGLVLIVNGRLTVGTFVIVITVSAAFTAFAQGLDELTTIWMGARSGNSRFTELLAVARPRADRGPVTTEALPDDRTGLELSGISHYVGGTRLLESLDLRVGPGELVAVIGGPGSGREVIGHLAVGMGSPARGTVRLDGVAMAMLDPAVRLAEAVLVPEEPFLFARSVRANLSVGRPADDAAIAAALEAAGATEVVAALPEGIETVLGDRGMTLSGGQRQRLALARALLHPPRLLVLDDALSAVPPALEQDIIARIRAHAPDTALLVVTRRESLRGVADAVVELPEPDAPVALPVDSGRELADAVLTSIDTMPNTTDIRSMAGPVSLGSGVVRNTPDDPRYAAAFGAMNLSDDLPEVTDAEATASDRRPTMGSVLRPFSRRLVQASAVMVLFVLVGLIPEGVMSIVIDAARDREPGRAYPVIGGLFVLGVLTGGLAYFQRIYRKKIDEGVLYMLRRRTFQRLTRLGVDFYDRELPGAVATRVVADLDRVSDFVDETVFRLVAAVTLFIATFGVIMVWSPPIGLTVLPFVPALAILAWVQYKLAKPLAEGAREELGGLVARMEEDFAGRDVVAAYGAAPAAREGFRAKAAALRVWRRRSAIVDSAGDQVFGLLSGLASAMLLLRAGNLHLDGAISVGAVVALNAYLRSVVAPVRIMASTLERYVPARVAFGKLGELYSIPVFPPEDVAALPCPPLDGDLGFDGVDFTYPGTRAPVLHDVTFDVAPGELVVLVGATGAGKSSVAKLLARVYDPTAGVVTVDGMDLRTIDIGTYRRRLGVVPQDGFCFAGTVASNISYGRPDATRAEIAAAVDAVGAREVIASIRGGLDGVVEEDGRNLGPAQRQLIALARVWLVQPDVLVLDEATSSLGAALEARVVDAVRELGVTTVFVAHRLAVAERADRVVVLDGGRVVGQGTHEELLESSEAYAALWGRRPEPPARARKARKAAKATR